MITSSAGLSIAETPAPQFITIAQAAGEPVKEILISDTALVPVTRARQPRQQTIVHQQIWEVMECVRSIMRKVQQGKGKRPTMLAMSLNKKRIRASVRKSAQSVISRAALGDSVAEFRLGPCPQDEPSGVMAEAEADSSS